MFFINPDFPAWSECCNNPDERLRHIVMRIFDSNSGQWRSSTNPPLADSPYFGLLFKYYPCSSVMFQGHLFVLFRAEQIYETTMIYRLLSYNIDQDMWEDMGVHIIDPANFPGYKLLPHIRSKPQLIVSDDRLFYLVWISDEADLSPSLCVCEVSLASKSHREVFKMTRTLVQQVFRTEQKGTVPRFDIETDIVGMGSNKSLIFRSKKTGITMGYDLVHNLLDHLPTNPMHFLPDGCELWYGSKTMDLCLPDRGRRRKRRLSTAAPA